MLNASIRTDASNRFGQDKSARFQPVWSVGLRWNMGREHFLEGQDFLNELSLRATYGYQGNVVENTGPDLIAYIPSGAAESLVLRRIFVENKKFAQSHVTLGKK